jgi:type IV pilus assembly protein PilO
MNFEMLREIIAARRKSFGLLALFLALDLCLVLVLSLWQQPELEKTQNDWFAKRDAAARGVDRGVSSRYQDAERDLALFQKRIIDKKDFAGFLSDLFAQARSNSLVLKGISYKPTPTKEAGLITYAIGCDVTGKYAGVKSFIADLARFPTLVTLDSIALGNSSPTAESVTLRVQMTVLLKTEGT